MGAIRMKRNLKYASYIIRHKGFVFVAGLKTGAPIWRLIIHDWSKMTRAEWTPYVNSFYGPQPRTKEVKRAFMEAWHHHVKYNPHHWNHWLWYGPDLEKTPVEMPEHFCREMVADWASAGRTITGKWEVASWYTEQKKQNKIQLHPETQKLVEELIAKIG